MAENKPTGPAQIKIEGNETLTRLLSELAKISPIEEITCSSEGMHVEWGEVRFCLTPGVVVVEVGGNPVAVHLTGDPVADVQTILGTAQVNHISYRISYHESMADYHRQCAADLRTELARGVR